MTQPELSAVVMVYNEMRTIRACLEPLILYCDEVVVVDDCSTDGTWEYLQTLPIKSFQHKHTTFAAQRQYVKDRATGRWILTVDGDEYMTAELARSIRAAIARPDAPDGFYIRLRNPYPRTLKGELYGEHPRLVRADKCFWIQTDDPHSPLDMRGLRFEVLKKGHLEHEPIANVATMLRKSINRSLIIATQQKAHGRRGGAWKLLFGTVARFFKFYVGTGAWRFGASGLVMAMAAAQEAFAKQAFLLEAPVDRPESLQDGGPGSYPAGTEFVTQRKAKG